MENLQNNVIGKALYLELRHGSYTNQVIIMPEGVDSHGNYVPTTTYRRRVSPLAPRKTWRAMPSMFRSERDESGALIQLGREHALATVPDRLGHARVLFDQLVAAGYTVFKQPIAVEVTREDLSDVYYTKTPYKVISRILRSRKALGFGDAIYVE
jgi:hypothetical protein